MFVSSLEKAFKPLKFRLKISPCLSHFGTHKNWVTVCSPQRVMLTAKRLQSARKQYFQQLNQSPAKEKTRMHRKQCFWSTLDGRGSFLIHSSTTLMHVPLCQRSCTFHNQKWTKTFQQTYGPSIYISGNLSANLWGKN